MQRIAEIRGGQNGRCWQRRTSGRMRDCFSQHGCCRAGQFWKSDYLYQITRHDKGRPILHQATHARSLVSDEQLTLTHMQHLTRHFHTLQQPGLRIKQAQLRSRLARSGKQIFRGSFIYQNVCRVNPCGARSHLMRLEIPQG